jgi:multiple sugar transport system permease protein
MKKNSLIYVLLVLITLFALTPFVLSVLGSLKSTRDILAWPPKVFSPPFHIENYARVWKVSPLFPRWFLNSCGLAAITVVIKLLSCSMAGYAFARLRFPGSKIFFWATLATMMIPGTVTLVPNYCLMARLGWTNTYLPLIIPGISDAFGVFLMTQFFKTIPRAYEDAARIDGATWFTIFRKVMLPLARPALVALAIFKFQGSWNDFLGPLIYLNTPSKFTLPLGLNFFKGQYFHFWELILAGSMFNAVPMLIIFLIFQRYFIKGIAVGGVKE